jgi:hypothetical protein
LKQTGAYDVITQEDPQNVSIELSIASDSSE